MPYFSLTKFIAGIYRESKNMINVKLAQLDIRVTESDILLVAFDQPGLTQKEIAAILRIDPTLLGRNLKRLATRNLVIRKKDSNDGRSVTILLTKEGYQIAHQIKHTLKQWWHGFFLRHPEIDEREFSEQLEKVYLALKQEGA